MKKNITINLCGRLYQIDEDAYEILQQYINSLRSVFGKSEGGDEIVDDIEARIAELFDELKQSGTEAITIDHVKDIIVRIGEPEQLAGDDEPSESKSSANEPISGKTNDKIIAGVMPRLAAKYGGKVTHWRIGFILLLFFIDFILFPFFKIQHYPGSMFFVLLNVLLVATYFILAILMPDKTDKQSAAQSSQNDATSGKPKTGKLYRNPNDKMLAGVLSGFAARFGGDVSLWRVGFIVLALFTTLLAVVAYVILAIVIPESETAIREPNSRKFYRNPNDKMVAGVLSGLAARFGGDASLWRVCFILLTVGAFVFAAPLMSFPYFGNAYLHFSGLHRELTICFANFFFIILYIVLAIIVPEAKMPEQLLQMRGKAVTPQNLATVVTEEQPKPRRSIIRRIFSFLLKIVTGFVALVAFVVCIAICVAMFAIIVASSVVFIFPSLVANFIVGQAVTSLWAGHPALVIVFLVSLLVLLAITIFGIVRMILVLVGKHKSIGIGRCIVLIALWIVALCIMVPSGVRSVEIIKQNQILDIHSHHSGRMEVKDDEYFKKCDSFGYYEMQNDHKSTVCDIRSTTTVFVPSHCKVSCVARAEGTGVYLFAAKAVSPEQPIAMVEVPSYGNTGGEIWQNSNDPEIRNMNEGQGFGWSLVTLEFDVESGCDLIYGITTDTTFTGKPSDWQWFSADWPVLNPHAK